jgi:uncharacterized protein DUF4272
MPGPTADQVADRALVLYALVRRAAIELALEGFGDDPVRIAQAERARTETERWLERESLSGAVSDVERRLFEAPSGSWPRAAIVDGMWRKEALGVLLWSLQHSLGLPEPDDEFEQSVLETVITRYGSVSSFRANGLPRDDREIEEAWLTADAWLGMTEGGRESNTASINAERFRALGWLRDASAPAP